MANSAKERATYADLEAVPPHLIAEIIDDQLVTRPVGVPLEAMVRTALASTLGLVRKGNAQSESSLILSNIELHVGSQVIVPDLASWRTNVIAPQADASYIEAVPDWVCEIRSSHTNDEIFSAKRRIYAAAGVVYLWSVDPRNYVLEAFVLQDGAWLLLRRFSRGDIVSAAPFTELTFPLADLWPLDPPATRENTH